MLKRGFPAIADADTRLFILGSLPGDRSLELGQYYGHHTNQFWKLIGALLGEELHALDYDSRLDRLRVHGVGLWDVFHAAEREGSADCAIRGATSNALGGLKASYPRLEAIAFNGGAAAKEGRRLLADVEGVRLYDLISSSGAAGVRLDAKIEKWNLIRQHLK